MTEAVAEVDSTDAPVAHTHEIIVPDQRVTERIVMRGRSRSRGTGKALASGSSRQRRWWLTLTAIVLLLVAGAYWAGTKATSPGVVAKQQAPAPRTLLTAMVILRHLSETLSVNGTIAPGSVYSIDFGPVSVPAAQPIVTQQPLRIGSLITNGSVVAQIAGQPIFVMSGTTPMYRDLTVGDTGSDVIQLQDDLEALGFGIQDKPGVFGVGTMRAVRAFYRWAGYSAPLLPGVSKSLGRLVVPQAEIVFVPHLPDVLERTSMVLGHTVTNPALVLAEGQLRAVTKLTEAQAALVRRGDKVQLYVSGRNGRTITIAAKVRAVSVTAGSQSAVIAPLRPLSAALDGANVTAQIVIASTRSAVLAVPVAALYTTADGQAFVTLVRDHRRINVPVQVGIEIAGYVPVNPLKGHLTAGDHVLVGE